MTSHERHPDRPDIYLTSHRNAYGWGGALSFGTGFLAACRNRGLKTVLLATDPDTRGSAVTRHVPIRRRPLVWRLQSWFTAGQLERALRHLPPPRAAFVGMNMFWVTAAKQAWPGAHVVYRLPCLLTNCLPFTWPTGRPPTLWGRADFAGLCRTERRALALADVILAPTAAARDETIALQPAARDRIVVCPYGPRPHPVNASQRTQQRVALGVGHDALVVLAAGVCDRNKGFDLAIREWPATDPRARLLVLGDGPDRDALRRTAASLRVADRVHLLGTQADTEPWYAAADGVLSTSHYDMYPNTIQEGLAFGRPAIVPQHAPPAVYAGVAEVIRQEGGGLLYDRAQPGALADAVNRLANTEGLAARLGQEALAAAQRRSGWDACVDAIVGPRGQSPASVARTPRDEPIPAGGR